MNSPGPELRGKMGGLEPGLSQGPPSRECSRNGRELGSEPTPPFAGEGSCDLDPGSGLISPKARAVSA